MILFSYKTKFKTFGMMEGKKSNKMGEHAAPLRFQSKSIIDHIHDPSDNHVCGSTNNVTFPSGRGRETARATFFGRIFGSATRSTGRVFGNFASGSGFTGCLAVAQTRTPTLDVVAHADWTCYSPAFERGSRQCASTAATEHVTAETTLVLQAPTIVGRGINMHGRPVALLQVYGTHNAHSPVVRRALVAITHVQPVVSVHAIVKRDDQPESRAAGRVNAHLSRTHVESSSGSDVPSRAC